jgi:hypothetical protein
LASSGYCGLVRNLRSLCLIAVLMVTVGCVKDPSNIDALRELPEATLVPRGATELTSGSLAALKTIEGSSAAQAYWIYGTDESAEEVLAFYREALAERGWSTSTRVSGMRNHEIEVEGWQRGGLLLRAGFWDLDDWRERTQDSRDHATVFEIRLIGDPAGTASASAP